MKSFKHIASLIKIKRIAHPNGLSQTDLSLLLGYRNGQFISNVERGLCNIPLKNMKKISEVLDIPPEELKKTILKDLDDTLIKYFNIQD